MIEDEAEYRPAPVSTPQPAMIPIKQFTAYTESGDPIEIVGVHYFDEETNFVGIVHGEYDEIWPSVITKSVYTKADAE